MKKHVVVATALVACLASSITFAQGYRWLDTSPLRHFTDEDWDILTKTAQDLLDDGADGSTADWSNPNSDSAGSITVINSYEEDGRQCKRAKFGTSARGLTGGGVYRLCKFEDGSWKRVP